VKERAPRERDVTSLLIVVFCLVKKSVAVPSSARLLYLEMLPLRLSFSPSWYVPWDKGSNVPLRSLVMTKSSDACCSRRRVVVSVSATSKVQGPGGASGMVSK